MSAAVSTMTPPSGRDIDSIRRARPTARQAAILSWIRDYIARERMPPTLREIGKAFAIRSTNGVNDHLRALERKGLIRRRDMASRGIVVVGAESGPAPSITETISHWKAENHALRVLLQRIHDASKRSPHITAEMAVLLGDVRAVLRSGGHS